MKKIKNMLKKGGIADIVTLMVIVGLVVALIIAVVLPMVEDARNSSTDNEEKLGGIAGYTEVVGSADDIPQ